MAIIIYINIHIKIIILDRKIVGQAKYFFVYLISHDAL